MLPGDQAPMRCYSALAKAATENGIEAIFGLMGDANLFFVDSFVREYSGRYVPTAHEAGAIVMALGYASVSGKIGVATVTHGPALTYALTGLVEGVKGRIPMVLLCGDTAAEDRDNNQNVSQRDLIVATGAGFEQVRSAKTMVTDFATAMRRAWGENRPVALNMPANFMQEMVEYAPVKVRHPERRGYVPDADLDNAIGIIAAARRPIIVGGRGAINPAARAALVRLAERTDALLATTLKAKGLFDGEKFNIGIFGTLSSPPAVDLILESDCVVAFGANLNQFTTSSGSFLKGKRVVQCNIDASEIGKFTAVDAAIVGDAELTADLFCRWLDEADIAPSGFRSDDILKRIHAYDPAVEFEDQSTETTIDLRKAILRIEAAVPKDRVCVTDGGRFSGEPRRFLTVSDPRFYIHPVNFGSIGLSVPAAIGAGVAVPGKPVLVVVGDGGFMHGGLVEFNTAVRCGVDLIVVVCNDGGYGAEHIQFTNRQMDPRLCLIDWPDLAPVADSLGGTGITVRTEADLARAAIAIKNRKKPLLIDLKLDPNRLPGSKH